MSVLFVSIPVSLLLGGSATLACIFSIPKGQFDDLESPPLEF
jgi:cbb3-type cytochrome oxidase maturation protein